METRLETSVLENSRLKTQLGKAIAGQKETNAELDKKKMENAQLMASLNDARAQLHFENQKSTSSLALLQTQIFGLQARLEADAVKLTESEARNKAAEERLQQHKEELSSKRNQMFELHTKVG